MHLILKFSSYGSTNPFFSSFSSFIKKMNQSRLFCVNTGSLDLPFWTFSGCLNFLEKRGGVGFTVIYVNVFLHESQPRVTAGWFFYSFHKSSYNHCSPAAPQPHLLFVRLLLGLLNWHVRPVKTAPRKQHIPDESFNWGFTYQSDEK